MVEAGETNVEAQPKLSKELVIESVELLRDVIAQERCEEARDISLFVQKKVETFTGPGNIAACRLGSQSDLRGVRSRERRFKLENISMFSREKHTATWENTALLLKMWEHPFPNGLAKRRYSEGLLLVCTDWG